MEQNFDEVNSLLLDSESDCYDHQRTASDYAFEENLGYGILDWENCTAHPMGARNGQLLQMQDGPYDTSFGQNSVNAACSQLPSPKVRMKET